MNSRLTDAVGRVTDAVSDFKQAATSHHPQEFAGRLIGEHEELLANDGLGAVGFDGDVVAIRHPPEIDSQDRELLLEFADIHLHDKYEFELVATDDEY